LKKPKPAKAGLHTGNSRPESKNPDSIKCEPAKANPSPAKAGPSWPAGQHHPTSSTQPPASLLLATALPRSSTAHACPSSTARPALLARSARTTVTCPAPAPRLPEQLPRPQLRLAPRAIRQLALAPPCTTRSTSCRPPRTTAPAATLCSTRSRPAHFDRLAAHTRNSRSQTG
jgi:hypothetical protein